LEFRRVLFRSIPSTGLRAGKGIEVVAVILPQKLLKPFPALSPVDGIAHAGGQQLHRVIPQLCDLMGPVIQIDNITHIVRRNRWIVRSEEHTSELQSRFDLVCRLLLEKKKTNSRSSK